MIASSLSRPGAPSRASAGWHVCPNLLLVQYDKGQLDLLSGYLGDVYHLLVARTTWNAVTLLEEQAVQLMIINAGPGSTQDGNKLCAHLKSFPRFASIPVILSIAGNSQAARIDCLRSGADGWLEHPLSRDYLRALVSNLVPHSGRVKTHTAPPHPDPGICERKNDAFLSRLTGFVADHLQEIDLNVDRLARLMHMSRPTLYRQIKCSSDLTPNELINLARLNKAAGLLSIAGYKIFEIVKMVGFNSRSNFGKAFLKHFGVTPREYQQRKKSS